MKNIDTITYVTEADNGETLTMRLAFSDNEPYEAYIERCKLIYESVKHAKEKHRKIIGNVK